MSNTPSTTTNSAVHAIKKLATAAAIAGALGLAALGIANGTAAAAPADDSGSTTSAASEQAGPTSPTAGPASPTGNSDGSAIPAPKSAPTAGPAATTTNTPTSAVGNGRQPGDSSDPGYMAPVPGGLPFNQFNNLTNVREISAPKSAPTAGPATKNTNTPTSTVGNGRQPGDSADDVSSAVTPSTETTNVFKQSIPNTVNQFEGRPDAQYPIGTPLWNLTPQQ